MKEDGQFLDWLRENRRMCEQSEDIYNEFMKNDCEPVYCRDATPKETLINRYTEECVNSDKNNQQGCKNLENRVKAFDELNC